MILDVVRADADDSRALGLIIFAQLRQARRNVFDVRAVIAHEDDQQGRLAGKIGERNCLAIRIRQ